MIRATWTCTTCNHEHESDTYGSFKEAMQACPDQCVECGKRRPWNSTEGFAMAAVEVKDDTKD